MGTPQIAVNSIMKLLNFADIRILGVVTQPDRPSGRGKKIVAPPIKICAEQNGIPVFQTASIRKDEALIEKLKTLDVDYFVTFAFGQLLSQEVLNIPKIATINMHASMLPKYRGANPIQRCIYNGDKETGITTMVTELGLDSGDICMSEKIEITDNMTNLELSDIISEKAPFLIYQTLNGISSGELVPEKQDEKLVSLAKKFVKEDGLINWKNSALSIHNQIRSMVDWPCSYTHFEGKCLKILSSEVVDFENELNSISGEVVAISKSGITIKTGEGSLLVKKVKPESKGEMDARAWANGVKLSVGKSFEIEKNGEIKNDD